MEISDERLIRLCKANNREGHELFYKKYEKYIYRLCYYYTHSKEDTLDLMQEVYLKIFRAFHSFQEGKPILPWIKRITVNTCLNFIRSQDGKKLSLNTSFGQEGFLEDTIAASTDVAEEVSTLDTKNILIRAIGQLPGDMKTAVILRHVENMSYNEIGEVMDLPIGTVKTYLFRGRKILMDTLKKEGIWEV